MAKTAFTIIVELILALVHCSHTARAGIDILPVSIK